jgi:thioredoxin reductase
MTWLLLSVVVALGIGLVALLWRRAELRHMRDWLQERERGLRQGADKAQPMLPVIDLSRCLGCGTCVAACPEEGVLQLVHGQAVVVNPAQCVGHARCEAECPVSAVVVAIDNQDERRDIPAIDGSLEAVGTKGLFLAGEITARALIRTAVVQGTAVAQQAQRRRQVAAEVAAFDLVIVGAGPGGLACALECKRLGLSALLLDREEVIGGTVAKYPRRKLVLTEPIELPLHGRLEQREFEKEELMALWQDIATAQELPFQGGETFSGLEKLADDSFTVKTDKGEYRARSVCLAVGRRGTPRRLNVPGEDQPKVLYSLVDAQSYRGRRVLVVGGGDSAVEGAIALAEQPGTEVTLAYRKESLFRIRANNEQRLRQRVAEGRVRVLFRTEVREVGTDVVVLEQQGPHGGKQARIANDEVFVMIGGDPPFGLLEKSGVSFDPALRPPPEKPVGVEQGSGLLRALGAAFGMAMVALLFVIWHRDYYRLPMAERAGDPKHALLRPDMGLGLGLGIAAIAAIAANLLYLLRRCQKLRWGSLRAWMTSHVGTGILALLLALLHGAMAPRDTAGGHALLALLLLLITGAVGRYFYAWVPRAANGRELELAAVRGQLEELATASQAEGRTFAAAACAEVTALAERRQWGSSFPSRLLALAGLQWDLRRTLHRLRTAAREQGVAPGQLGMILALANEAHHAALQVAHYEDLRALLGTWRWLHRWLAALMLVLVGAHVVLALAHGTSLFDGGSQ